MRLQSQINDLAGQKQSLAQTAVQQQVGVEALNQRLNVQAAELSEYRSKIVGYMMDHKMVVIALAAGVAGAEALDSNNSFSEDAKNVGGWAVAVAAIYALANLGEVSDVLNNLNQADAHVHFLEAGMAQTRSQIQQQQLSLQSINNQLAEITQKVENLQARLDHL
jgi:chromosome segregation ATPase